MHGGTIEARSAGPGQGSEFIVRLPVAPIPAARGKSKAPADKRQGKKRAHKRILVVDDNPDQANSLGMLLRLMGHEVRLAYDGLQAVAAAEEFLPEAALIDIGLPGLNGYDVARRIRQHPKLAKIVLVAQTGWGQEDDHQRSKEAGFDHHIVKPVDPDALRRIIGDPPGKRAGAGRRN